MTCIFNEKKMKQELNTYNTNEIDNILSKSIGIEEQKAIDHFVCYAIKRTKNIIPLNTKQRIIRDTYFSKILCLSLPVSLAELVDVSLHKIKKSEKLFDLIRADLKKNKLTKKSVECQVWSNINSTQNEIENIRALFKKTLANNIKSLDIQNTRITLKNETGDDFSPDFALENFVNSLSLSLSMLAHEFSLFNDGYLVIPSEVNTITEDEEIAYDVAVKAVSWKHLELASASCLLFDGEVFHREGSQLMDLEKQTGVNSLYHFHRDSFFERIDSISNERLLAIISQHHIESLTRNQLLEKIVGDIKKPLTLNDDWYLSSDEKPSCDYLYHMLSLNKKNSNKEFGGLNIREWVRCYSFVKHLANKGITRSAYEHSILQHMYHDIGITNIKLERFLTYACFNKKSRDLYDSPFIKQKDGKFLLLASHFHGSNLINIINSVFSSYDLIPAEKGYGFEEQVFSLLKKTGHDVRTIKFKRGSQEYEYDALLLMGNRLFVVECKNSTLSYGSPDMASRKKTFFDEAAAQVKRLTQGLQEYPEVLLEIFGKKVEDLELIPIIVNCMPFSWPGRYNDVYITDISALGFLIKNREFTYSIYSKYSIERHGLRKQWEGDELTSDDIINHLSCPPQLVEYLDASKHKSWWYPANNTTFYCDRRVVTDHELLSGNRKKILGEG